jgi:hypothetical protein
MRIERIHAALNGIVESAVASFGIPEEFGNFRMPTIFPKLRQYDCDRSIQIDDARQLPVVDLGDKWRSVVDAIGSWSGEIDRCFLAAAELGEHALSEQDDLMVLRERVNDMLRYCCDALRRHELDA